MGAKLTVSEFLHRAIIGVGSEILNVDTRYKALNIIPYASLLDNAKIGKRQLT